MGAWRLVNTGYLIDEYYVGSFKIQKRAVCGVKGNLLTYSYEAFGNETNFYSDDCLSEREALKKLFDAVTNSNIKSNKKLASFISGIGASLASAFVGA